MVMISFIVLAMTWLTKKPGFFDGWIYLLPEHDASVLTVSFIFYLSSFPVGVAKAMSLLPFRLGNPAFCGSQPLSPMVLL